MVGKRLGFSQECGFVGVHGRGQGHGIPENSLYVRGEEKYIFPASQLMGSEVVVVMCSGSFYVVEDGGGHCDRLCDGGVGFHHHMRFPSFECNSGD